MRENMDQKNSEYGHFLRSEMHCLIQLVITKWDVEMDKIIDEYKDELPTSINAKEKFDLRI